MLLGGLLRSVAEGEVSCVVVETSPSTSAGAASPTDESTGTARYSVYTRATTAGGRRRLFSRRCDRKYRAQMEARVQRSYSLNVPSVEVRPLPNAQSVATNGPNPRALGLGSGVLLGPPTLLLDGDRWHSFRTLGLFCMC